MPAKVKATPDGCHTATPYLIIQGAAAALDFYQKVFGVSELVCSKGDISLREETRLKLRNFIP